MPPLAGPRALQVSRTLARLARLGWPSTVVCVDPRPGGPLLRDASGGGAFAADGVDLVRVPSPEESAWCRAAFRMLPPFGRLPDRQQVWIGAATRAAGHRMNAAGHNVIVSFAQPWSDHLIGLRLHRTHRLPWVAHFSDPWTDSPYLRGSPWLRARWARMEADVVRDANALVFVTPQTADAVMRKYPDAWRRKAHVVPHGYDAAQGATIVPEARGQARRLRIAYTGRFYAGLRTPGPLFEAIAQLRARGTVTDEIEVRLLGPEMSLYEAQVRALGLESVVVLGERVSHADALRAAATADVLLVVDAPSRTPSLFLPSKLVDYLMWRKPILGLTPPQGATADLLRRLGCPLVAPDDVAGIASAIEALVSAWRAGGLQVSDTFDEVAREFDIERTTAGLAQILDQWA